MEQASDQAEAPVSYTYPKRSLRLSPAHRRRISEASMRSKSYSGERNKTRSDTGTSNEASSSSSSSSGSGSVGSTTSNSMDWSGVICVCEAGPVVERGWLPGSRSYTMSVNSVAFNEGLWCCARGDEAIGECCYELIRSQWDRRGFDTKSIFTLNKGCRIVKMGAYHRRPIFIMLNEAFIVDEAILLRCCR